MKTNYQCVKIQFREIRYLLTRGSQGHFRKPKLLFANRQMLRGGCTCSDELLSLGYRRLTTSRKRKKAQKAA